MSDNILHLHFRSGGKLVLTGKEADDVHRSLPGVPHGQPITTYKDGWEITIYTDAVETSAFKRKGEGDPNDTDPEITTP